MHARQHVVHHADALEQVGNLENAHHPGGGNLGRMSWPRFTPEQDGALVGFQVGGQTADQGGFARSVWADDSVDTAAPDLQIDSVEGRQPTEAFDHAFGGDDDLIAVGVVSRVKNLDGGDRGAVWCHGSGTGLGTQP